MIEELLILLLLLFGWGLLLIGLIGLITYRRKE